MQLDLKKIVFVLLLFVFCKTSAFSQSFKIVEKTINSKLFTFDSLRSTDKSCLITIFYKDGGLKNDCNKSSIINSSNQDCNFANFKKKLIKELNNCSFLEETTIQFYIYPKEKRYFLKDKNNKKTNIENIMAFVSNYGNEFYTVTELSNYLKELNKKSEQPFIPTNKNAYTNSIFEFSSEIHKKSINPSFSCPSDIHVLNRLKNDLIAGNSCPALDIPFEDIFIKHLVLLFQPNLILNKQISYYKNKYLELEREKDSLNKSYRINSAYMKNLWSKSSIELNGRLGLVNSNSLVSDLENLNSTVSLFNSLNLSFVKGINEKVTMYITAELFNMQGDFELKSTEDSWNDDIGADNPLQRTNSISGLRESWIINNGVASKIGFSYLLTSFNDKLLIRSGAEIGKVFPFMISSKLEEAEFNYRAKINNIDAILKNIPSLGLYDEISYNPIPSQKNQFSGFVIGLNTTATYLLTKKLYSKIFIDYSIFNLKNQDYNSNSKVSRYYGEFSSTMYQIKSLRISPLTIGFGLGLKI